MAISMFFRTQTMLMPANSRLRLRPYDYLFLKYLRVHGKSIVPDRCVELPVDVIERILGHLDIIDRTRVSLVCKQWQSIINNKAFSAPWLVRSSTMTLKDLSCFSMSNGSTRKLSLPGPAQGGGLCGSSKGWLILAKGHGELILVNPLSRALHPLPSLTTIPAYNQVMGNISDQTEDASFFSGLDLSSSIASECIVAAVVNSGRSIVFCRPEDRSWSIFEGIPEARHAYGRIVFFNKTLYALYGGTAKDSFNTSNGQTLRTKTTCEITLKLVPELKIDDCIMESQAKSSVHYSMYLYRMVPSTDGKLLVIALEADEFYPLNLGGLDEQLSYLKTSRFKVFSVDPDDGQITRLERLDDQALFLSRNGSLALSANTTDGFQGNCIYFADSLQCGPCCDSGEQNHDQGKLFYDTGIYYLNQERIKRPFPRVDLPTEEQVLWLDLRAD